MKIIQSHPAVASPVADSYGRAGGTRPARCLSDAIPNTFLAPDIHVGRRLKNAAPAGFSLNERVESAIKNDSKNYTRWLFCVLRFWSLPDASSDGRR